MERKKVSAGQLRMIYGLAKKAGIDTDALHDIAARICKKDSLAALTMYDAKRLIDTLQRYTGESKPDTCRATPAQQSKIHALARGMGWADDPKRLRGFLEKLVRVSDARFLSPAQAGIVIEALKAIEAGGRAERRVEP